MANKNNPIGGKPINNLVACDYNAKSNKYYIPASDTDDIWINDFVVLTNNSNDDGIPIIRKAVAGDELLGVVDAVKSIQEKNSYIYRKGSEERIIYVVDAPFIEFEIQVNGTITNADIGKFADIEVGAGNAATGISGTQLDLATLSTDSGQLKILGILEREKNEWGALAHVRCFIYDHQSGSSTDIFQRVGSTISPVNSGDDLDMGTGDVTATNAHFTGKLTVDGAIDPTALILDGQAVAPGTDNGTIYYDSVSTTFKFRENGSWSELDKANLTDEQQVYSIGVEGLATNSGLNVDEKMDQPATAIAAISTLRGGAWTPSADEAVTIDCRDSGTYGLISIKADVTQYINVNMESARCVDTVSVAAVSLTDNTYVCCKEIISNIASGGSAAISKYAGSGSATVRTQLAQSSAGAYSNVGIEVLVGELITYVDHIVVNAGENGINLANGTSLYHKGISCPYDITIGDNCTAIIELDTLGTTPDTGNINLGEGSYLYLKVHGNWAGSLLNTRGINTIFSAIIGNRTAVSNDYNSTGSSTSMLVLGNGTNPSDQKLYLETGRAIVRETYFANLKFDYLYTYTYTSSGGYSNGYSQIIRLNSSSSETLTFNENSGDISNSWVQAGFAYIVNVNTGAWTIAEGTATIKSNRPLTPIEPNETVFVVRESKTNYHLMRSELNKRTDAGAANYNPSVLTSDRIITANNSAAPRNIIISTEDVESGSTTTPRVFTIKDEYLNAFTNNLTITLENGGTIDGAASLVMSADGDSVELYSTGTNCFVK